MLSSAMLNPTKKRKSIIMSVSINNLRCFNSETCTLYNGSWSYNPPTPLTPVSKNERKKQKDHAEWECVVVQQWQWFSNDPVSCTKWYS